MNYYISLVPIYISTLTSELLGIFFFLVFMELLQGCEFCFVITVIQLYVYTHPFSFIFFFHMDYQWILGRVLCAIYSKSWTCYNFNVRKKTIKFKQGPLIILCVLSVWFTFIFDIFICDIHTDSALLYSGLSFLALILWFCLFNFFPLFMLTKAPNSVCTKDFISWQSTYIS